MKKLKNWDNKTWLSSNKYIVSLNTFLKNNIKLKKNYKILDIGCGRAYIIDHLYKKYKFNQKPFGIDIIKHRDISKKIRFKKIDAIKFLSQTNETFDLIFVKQTIHFFTKKNLKKLVKLMKLRLKNNGRIVIMSLDTKSNEIPCFSSMKIALEKSLEKDKYILKILKKNLGKFIEKKFVFKVILKRNDYIRMLKNRYISCMLKMSAEEIKNGVNEILRDYSKKIVFKDKLICLIYKN